MDINVRLTGRTRYRSSLFGKQILQVEEAGNSICKFDFSTSPEYSRWRDATSKDLTTKAPTGADKAEG